MGGSWDIPNRDSESGESKWLAKGNSVKVIQTAVRALEVHLCVYPQAVFFFHPKKKKKKTWLFQYFLFLWELFSVMPKSQGLLLTTSLVARIWCPHRHRLASTSVWKPKSRLKLLQVKATQDQYEKCEPCFCLCIKYFISRVLSLGSVSRATSTPNNFILSSLYYLKPPIAKATGEGKAITPVH